MDKRIIAGAVAAILSLMAVSAWAQDYPLPPRDKDPVAVSSGDPLFSDEPLARNTVARDFGVVDALKHPPEIAYITADGEKTFADLTGKIRLLVLWAEWCPPCMNQMAEMAKLQSKYGGEKFEIVAVLSGSSSRMGYTDARKAVDAAGAANLPLMIEPMGARQTLAMAIPNPSSLPSAEGRPSIPCVILVDATGQARGRIMGLKLSPEAAKRMAKSTKRAATDQDSGDKATLKTQTVTRPLEDNAPAMESVWSTSAAEGFIQALLIGALDTAN